MGRAFIFAYAKSWFSHDAAQISLGKQKLHKVLLLVTESCKKSKSQELPFPVYQRCRFRDQSIVGLTTGWQLSQGPSGTENIYIYHLDNMSV